MERQTIDITIRDLFSQSDTPLQCTIVVGNAGLNACISTGTKVLALRGWHFDQANANKTDTGSALRDMNTVLATEPLFDYDFERVSIFISNAWATMVPNRLFNEQESADTYLKLLVLPGANLKTTSSPLKTFGCQLVYGIENPILTLLLSKFPTARFSHVCHPLLLAWHQKVQGKDPMVFINFRNHLAQIAIFNRGELQFFNTFGFTTPSDFIYFALLPFQQLKLDPLEVPLTLSGEIIEFSALHKILMRYIRKIHFMPRSNNLDLPGAVMALPDHFHFDLFSGVGS